VDGAIDALRHSVTLDNNDAGAFNTLGLLLKKKGDAQGAQEAFDKAAEIRAAEEQAKEKSLRRGATQVAH
jgi:Flp pilus assembly protein TadD